MKIFNTFGQLAAAKVLTGTPVRVLEPALIDGVVEATGEGLSLLSGNVFVPSFGDQESITARKTSLLDDAFTGGISAYINTYKKDNSGNWLAAADGRTSAVFYAGQVWWPLVEIPYTPSGYLITSWGLPTGNPDILEVTTSIGTVFQFNRFTGLIDGGNSGGSTVSDTPPVNPLAGNRWTRCSDMKSFIWYVDNNGSQWVEDNPSMGAGTHNAMPELNAIGGHDAIYSREFNSVSSMTSAIGVVVGSSIKTKFHTVAPYGSAIYDVMTVADYTAITGLTSPDNKRDHDIIGGYIAVLRPINGIITVQQCGAIPFDFTAPTAVINKDAFRSAHLSLQTEFDALKGLAAPRIWTTKVESGDYNLSNGYAVPKGMVSFCDSLGAARVKILGATVDANPKLPCVILGKVISGTTTIVSTGLYVTAPPPKVHNLYVNPQNSNIGVDISNIPGFTIGDLWIQASDCINVGDGTGDGVIGRIFMEDSSVNGLVLGTCQNLVIDELYTFNMGTPLLIKGNPNNITIGMLQANYSNVSGIQTNDGTTPRNVTIGTFIFNQNTQHAASAVRLRSSSCDIRIDRMEAYNYNGYAVTNETGVSNSVDIGKAVLKQQRSKDDYSQGTTAKGFNANNCKISVGELITDTLASAAIGVVTGTFTASITVKGGTIAGQVATTPLVEITNTSAGSFVRLADLDNKSGKPIFGPQSVVEVSFTRVKNPFPIVTEGGRSAIKIPFNKASMYEFVLRANTNPAGNSSYRRVAKYIATTEIFFNSGVVWNAELTEQFNSAQGTEYLPKIALQVDIGSVGSSSQIPITTSDYLVISIPTSYGKVAYNLENLIY